MTPTEEVQLLAAYMIEKLGDLTLHYADCAAIELEQVGELDRARAWRAVRQIAAEILDKRLTPCGQTIH